MLGKSTLQCDNDNKIMLTDPAGNVKQFKATEGVYDLIFSKKPTNYDDVDKTTYKYIGFFTNLAHRNHDADAQVMGNRGSKWKII